MFAPPKALWGLGIKPVSQVGQWGSLPAGLSTCQPGTGLGCSFQASGTMDGVFQRALLIETPALSI